MPRLSPDELAARRQALVDAAGRCLDRSDGRLTARAVAAEAGVSVGAVYHHFDGLDALRAAAVEQRLVAGIGAVAAQAPASEDPLSWAVRALVCGGGVGGPGAASSGGAAGRATGGRRVVEATLDEVLRAAAAGGGLRPDVDVDALAEVLALLWEAIDRRVGTEGLRTSVGRLATLLDAVLQTGVRPATNG